MAALRSHCVFTGADCIFTVLNLTAGDANRHIRYYRNTFQHGGISMEEMIVPYLVLKPKR